jgi:hypothetical protein
MILDKHYMITILDISYKFKEYEIIFNEKELLEKTSICLKRRWLKKEKF